MKRTVVWTATAVILIMLVTPALAANDNGNEPRGRRLLATWSSNMPAYEFIPTRGPGSRGELWLFDRFFGTDLEGQDPWVGLFEKAAANFGGVETLLASFISCMNDQHINLNAPWALAGGHSSCGMDTILHLASQGVVITPDMTKGLAIDPHLNFSFAGEPERRRRKIKCDDGPGCGSSYCPDGGCPVCKGWGKACYVQPVPVHIAQ